MVSVVSAGMLIAGPPLAVEIQNCGIGIIGKCKVDAFGDVRKQCDGRVAVADMLDCRLQAGICVVADLCHG